MSGLTDAQVVALAREVPEEALKYLYDSHRARIYTFLLRLVGDPETADDLTQDTFSKAYVALSGLTSSHRVLPWLYRIANNAAIDLLRRRHRFRWLGFGAIDGTPDEPRELSSEESVEDREVIGAILRTLPPENAAALLLHAAEGYSYREIAEIQGCSMTAVRSRIARAREAFRASYATKHTL